MRKEQALLTHEQFERELNYDVALSVASKKSRRLAYPSGRTRNSRCI